MKIFTNRNLIQKVILAFVCVTLIEFCISPHVVRAETSFGGELMGAMRDFITAVADVAISVVQWGLTGEWLFAVDERGSVVDTGIKSDGSKATHADYWDEPEDFNYPIIQISPELIFSNQVRLLDIDFIGGGSRDSYIIETENKSGIETLRRVIASWYVTLRTIAIVGLLSVLIYIGIRIIISSTMQDRAKYKQRLMDWVIAFCLLFFMHYIMAAVINVVDRVNDTLSAACGLGSGTNESGKVDESSIEGITLNPEYGGVVYKYLSSVQHAYEQANQGISTEVNVQGQNAIIDKIIEWLENNNDASNKFGNITAVGANTSDGTESIVENIYTNGNFNIVYDQVAFWRDFEDNSSRTKILLILYPKKGPSVQGVDIVSEDDISSINQLIKQMIANDEIEIENAVEIENSSKVNRDGKEILVSPDPNKVLYFINYARMYLNCENNDEYMAMAFGYLFIYIILIVFTGMFAIRYVKRVIYIAFLTLMAPLVSLTYPLDKIKDRKSSSI